VAENIKTDASPSSSPIDALVAAGEAADYNAVGALIRSTPARQTLIDDNSQPPSTWRFFLRETSYLKKENEKQAKRELVRNHILFSNREVEISRIRPIGPILF